MNNLGVVTDFDDDGLSGIGDTFKKIAGIALASAGAIAAPFTGGLSTALIGVGGTIAGGLIGGIGAAKAGQAKGLAAITAFVKSVLDGFDTLKNNPQMSKADKVNAGQKLVALLDDNNAVYQAKKGKDAEALATGKTQAKAKLAELESLPDIAVNSQGQTTVNGVAVDAKTGEPLKDKTFLNTTSILGVSNLTLALGAAGAAAGYFFIFKRGANR